MLTAIIHPSTDIMHSSTAIIHPSVRSCVHSQIEVNDATASPSAGLMWVGCFDLAITLPKDGNKAAEVAAIFLILLFGLCLSGC